jgi:hypothetical protein
MAPLSADRRQAETVLDMNALGRDQPADLN